MPMKSPEDILVTLLFDEPASVDFLEQLGEYSSQDTTFVVHYHHVFNPKLN